MSLDVFDECCSSLLLDFLGGLVLKSVFRKRMNIII